MSIGYLTSAEEEGLFSAWPPELVRLISEYCSIGELLALTAANVDLPFNNSESFIRKMLSGIQYIAFFHNPIFHWICSCPSLSPPKQVRLIAIILASDPACLLNLLKYTIDNNIINALIPLYQASRQSISDEKGQAITDSKSDTKHDIVININDPRSGDPFLKNLFKLGRCNEGLLKHVIVHAKEFDMSPMDINELLNHFLNDLKQWKRYLYCHPINFLALIPGISNYLTTLESIPETDLAMLESSRTHLFGEMTALENIADNFRDGGYILSLSRNGLIRVMSILLLLVVATILANVLGDHASPEAIICDVLLALAVCMAFCYVASKCDSDWCDDYRSAYSNIFITKEKYAMSAWVLEGRFMFSQVGTHSGEYVEVAVCNNNDENLKQVLREQSQLYRTTRSQLTTTLSRLSNFRGRFINSTPAVSSAAVSTVELVPSVAHHVAGQKK